MLKLLTTFSSDRGFKECRVRLCPGHDGSARGRAAALWRASRCVWPETGTVAKGAQDGDRTPYDNGALAAGPSAAGTRRFRAAYLTVWGVPERRTDCMDAHMQTAEAVRQACLAAALQAYEEARISGLCHEGAGHVPWMPCGHCRSARWSRCCSSLRRTRRAEGSRRQGRVLRPGLGRTPGWQAHATRPADVRERRAGAKRHEGGSGYLLHSGPCAGKRLMVRRHSTEERSALTCVRHGRDEGAQGFCISLGFAVPLARCPTC
jgi:hypothetical protein